MEMLILRNCRICVTGGAGFLGQHVVDVLLRRGVSKASLFITRRAAFDLTRVGEVERLYAHCQPEVVIHLAAVVGGIGANQSHPGMFFHDNMLMGLHMIEMARHYRVRKFVQVGTVCAYPKHCVVPFREEDLWNGFPEETNAPYGVAKRALLVMLDAYRQEFGLASAALLPVNLYGPGDNFDVMSSHVVPALIRNFLKAKACAAGLITCWGTGSATREFLYVTDAAEAIVRATERIEEPTPINLGTSKEITIRDLAERIAHFVGYDGRIEWDTLKPDGQPRRCLDVTRARKLLDWEAKIDLDEGLKQTIGWYIKSTGQAEPSEPASNERGAASPA
jgi:GDP-L-fucose synthase